MKLEEAITRYVRRKQATGISFCSAERFYQAFLRTVGDQDLSNIDVNEVWKFLNRTQPSATVFRVKHSLLRRLFEYWVAHGEIVRPPMPANRPRKRSTFAPYIYTREELRCLLRLAPACTTRNDKMHPKTLRTILLVLYATGATVGEVTMLETENIDLQNGIIRFPGNRIKASRSIPIGRDLVRVVQQYVQWCKRTRKQGEYLFLRIDGESISPRAVKRNFERLRDRAGIIGIRGSSQKPCVRDLRATFAVHQIESWIKRKQNLNLMLPALGAYIGNAGIESTEKYLRLTPQRFENALNKLSPPTLPARWRADSALLNFLLEL